MIKLNEQQQKAAQFLSGICSTLAVPGSGKTLTMSYRIVMLIKQYGVSPENILGLTFTRNAAQAMKDKLIPLLDGKAGRVNLSTIHSFCHSLLRNEGRNFEIISGKEQITFLKKIMQKMRLKNFPTAMVLREISLAKNNLVSLEEFRYLYESDPTMLKIAEVFERYEQEKRKKLFLDFDDLLVETHLLLKNDREKQKKYQTVYRHLLVDEYQDINPAQMEILKLLINNNKNGSSFWVCGDDAQAIYSFTGASVSNILNFKELFPEAEQFILSLNYRSTPQITKACQNLIRNNSKRIDKHLATINENGEDLIIFEANDEEDEALHLVNEISTMFHDNVYNYQDMAVLYRANYQSRVIEEAFSQLKIPYKIENGMNFYDRYEVKVLLEYLRLINNPVSDEGDEALKTVINVPNRYIGRKFMTELEDYSNNQGIRLYEGLKIMPINVPYLRRNVNDLVYLLNQLITDAQSLEPAELIYLLRESLDYDKYISDDEIPSPDDSKIANVNQLHLMAAKYKNIPNLLKYTDTFRNQYTQDKDGVSLMTIHKSKGLEYPVVFVIGLVEGILPNKNGEIEEERRIAFVAMSRAMKRLYLSYPKTYLSKSVKSSRFLSEIK